MRFNDNHDAGNAIAEIAEDTYRMLCRKDSMIGDDTAVFEYRVSISDYKADVDENVFFFFAMDKYGYVWISMSDELGFALPNEHFVFHEEHADDDGWTRARGSRRYIFSDVFSDMIRRRLDEITERLENPGRPFLWNTMNMIRRINADEARIAYYGEDTANEIKRMTQEGSLVGVMLAAMK